ncbi:MAG: MBL fold metallo-hydrolase [Ruminococcaceae bacterium]|nr:MBL fold metallo-hydrolase [Oscillospiraceae bacterium]
MISRIKGCKYIMPILLTVVAVLLLASCSDEVLGDGGTESAVGTGGYVTGNTAVSGNEPTATTDQLEILLPDGTETEDGDTHSIPEIVTLPETATAQTVPDLVIGDDPDELYADAANTLRVDFLKTGKSDAIILRMDDKVVLVDTGDSDDYGKISGYLDSYGITTVDMMIITHFDNDHVGSASKLVKNYAVKTVYTPDYIRDSSRYRALMSAVDEAGGATKLLKISEDVELDMGYGSIWLNTTQLYPTGQTLGSDEANEFSEENNYSLIVTVTFGKTRLLITGDAERERMEEFNAALTQKGASLDYTLVKMPHHGAYTKGIDATLRAVTPRYCVICTDSGTGVEASTVTLMRSVGAAAYYTYNGDIYFVTDGTSSVLTAKG